MKTLNITFTDEEYKRLVKARRKQEKKSNTRMSWHKFIINNYAKGYSCKKETKK